MCLTLGTLSKILLSVAMIRALHLLLFFSLLFWGYQIDKLVVSGLMLLALSLVMFWLKPKTFTLRSFYQFADFCVLILIAIAAWYWLDDDVKRITFPTLQLLPLALFPLLIAQYMHQGRRIPLATFYIWHRKQSGEVVQWLDVTWPFILLCLFSAGAVKVENELYFIVVLAVMWVWLLLQQGKYFRFQLLGAGSMFIVVVGLALGVNLIMQDLQHRIHEGMNAWLQGQYDKSSQSSSMGKVGREKLSDDIVLRLKTKTGELPPHLLQIMNYQYYNNENWFTGGWSTRSLQKQKNDWSFDVKQALAKNKVKTVRIFQQAQNGEAELALPSNVFALEGLVAEHVMLGMGGRVEASVKRPFLAYDAVYAGEDTLFTLPNASDLKVAKKEQKWLAQVAGSLQLKQMLAKEGEKAVMQRIQSYLRLNFRYLSWDDNPRNHGEMDSNKISAMEDFLLHTKAGHCEYFATAAALLLRESGIPSRYVVGYAINERVADTYVARGRDAHAWAVGYVHGRWQVLDATPPDWLKEETSTSWLQSIKDTFSDLKFAYQTWRYNDEKIAAWIWYLLLFILLAVLTWRTLRRVEILTKEEPEAQTKRLISDWRLLEEQLVIMHGPRRQGEALVMWLERMGEQDLIPFARQYYVVRFGSALDEIEKIKTLNQAVAKVLLKRKQDE